MVEVSFSPKKCSKLEMKASDYLNSMENSVFQFTVSDFCLVEPSLINDVLSGAHCLSLVPCHG